jgi:hypothetical protein
MAGEKETLHLESCAFDRKEPVSKQAINRNFFILPTDRAVKRNAALILEKGDI